ncbi:Tol-Pal system protein TolB [Paraconexibacter sp. AEG42_29]|uniref:Tol-Pal system protein TolB n=1 Tax=Paraconexibacter sp. AEG42_29 TaxID=2997339 RepID=A0AAU7ASH3_9ACTN
MNRPTSAVLIALVAAAAVPAAAHATLVYDKNVPTAKPSVYVAKDDASSPRRLGAGRSPDLSPDGRTVAWEGANFSKPTLVVASTTGAATPRTLLTDYRSQGLAVAWSPDSTAIAAMVGPEIKARTLVIANVATGARTTVGKGFFGSASFSPAGDQLVYAKGAKDDFRYDLYRYDLATGKTTKLTTDRRAQSPLWGPKGIVFTRLVDASVRKYGPKGELYTISPAGKSLKRLTSQPVASLLFGLSATQFSADGTRLLGQFTGQDTSYAQVVDPATGKVRTLGKAEETGYEGYALSRNGSTVLAATGGFDPSGPHDIVTVPYAGGPAKLLVKNAFRADWDR